MKWFELLKFSFGNLWRRKLRTSLTVLGVMIGTASIVVMMSLGIGFGKQFTGRLEDSSTLTLIRLYNYRYGPDMSEDGVKLTDDTIAEMAAMEHVKCASPLYNFTAMLKSGKYESWMNCYSMSYDMLAALKLPVMEGSFPQRGDPLSFIVGKEIGYSFYDPKSNDYYYGGYYADGGERPEPTVDMMDDTVYITYDMDSYYEWQSGMGPAPKKYIFEVGALVGYDDPEKGYSEYDYNIYADMDAVRDTFQKIFKKNPWPNQQVDKNGKPITPMTYDEAYIMVDDIDHVIEVQDQLISMGYQANSELDYLNAMKEESRMIQYILAGIGSVSMIVAAIGITNTMIMSIFERTKEIGIFKVLGCSLSNIRTMFLMEAALIGLSGGVLGVAFSFGLSAIINPLIGNLSVIPMWLALLGMGFAVIVGMVAGISPALRAVKLSPLEAIRTL